MYASNALSGTRNVTPGTGITVASFNIKNEGNTAVDLKYVTIKRTDENIGSAQNEHEVKGLRLFDSSAEQVSKNTDTKQYLAFDNHVAKLELNKPIRIAKGETKTFEVKIAADDKMSNGHNLTLQLIPEETCYGKAGSTANYEIGIDNTDNISLGTVTAKD